MFSVLNDDFLSHFCFMVMLLLFPFSCGVHYLLCFAYLQNDLNDPFQYAFWRSNLTVLLKNRTVSSPLELYIVGFNLNSFQWKQAESVA